MGLEELRHVKLGSLEDLGLSDVHIMERINALRPLSSASLQKDAFDATYLAGLLNLSPNALRDKLLH